MPTKPATHALIRARDQIAEVFGETISLDVFPMGSLRHFVRASKVTGNVSTRFTHYSPLIRSSVTVIISFTFNHNAGYDCNLQIVRTGD